MIVQALPGAISSQGRAGIELAGSVIELSLAPNWTGVEARLEAGAAIAAVTAGEGDDDAGATGELGGEGVGAVHGDSSWFEVV